MRSTLVTLLATSETEPSGYSTGTFIVFAVFIGLAFLAIYFSSQKR